MFESENSLLPSVKEEKTKSNILGDSCNISDLKRLSNKKRQILLEMVKLNTVDDISTIMSRIYSSCGKFATIKTCENNHSIAKINYCNSEFCPVCNEQMSKAHKRKISRMLPYVFSFNTLGYYVFTIPKDLVSVFFSDVKYKNAIQKEVKKFLNRFGISFYVGRWHWSGEKSDSVLFPHLNILFEGEYIQSENIDKIRECWKSSLEKVFNVELNSVDCYYQYYKEYEEYYHKVKYVCRHTLRYLELSVNDLLKVFNFLYKTKNTYIVNAKKFNLSLGNKKLEDYRTSVYLEYSEDEIRSAIDSLKFENRFRSGICPICLKPVCSTVFDKIDSFLLSEPLQNGYYLLNNNYLESKAITNEYKESIVMEKLLKKSLKFQENWSKNKAKYLETG